MFVYDLGKLVYMEWYDILGEILHKFTSSESSQDG
jgi:hypothetical protein